MMRVSTITRWSTAVLLGIVASGLPSRASAQDLKTQQVKSEDEGDYGLVL